MLAMGMAGRSDHLESDPYARSGPHGRVVGISAVKGSGIR